MQINSSWFQVEPWLVALIAIAIAAFLAVAITWGIKAHRRVILAGREEMIGKTAEVKTVMNPKGTVLIQGELWTAILEAGQAVPGDEVVITKVDRLRVSVTKSKEVNR
jgi:membrane-bound serine protease (ClpP class)